MAEATPRQAWWTGWILVAIGIVLMLMAADVIPTDDDSWNAPRWLGAVCGVMVLLGGALALFQAYGVSGRSALYNGVAALVLTLFDGIFGWVAFGPGERHFSGSSGIGWLWSSRRAGDMEGRIAFGFLAVVMAFPMLWAWRHFVRLLRAPRDAGGSPD